MSQWVWFPDTLITYYVSVDFRIAIPVNPQPPHPRRGSILPDEPAPPATTPPVEAEEVNGKLKGQGLMVWCFGLRFQRHLYHLWLMTSTLWFNSFIQAFLLSSFAWRIPNSVRFVRCQHSTTFDIARRRCLSCQDWWAVSPWGWKALRPWLEGRALWQLCIAGSPQGPKVENFCITWQVRFQLEGRYDCGVLVVISYMRMFLKNMKYKRACYCISYHMIYVWYQKTWRKGTFIQAESLILVQEFLK